MDWDQVADVVLEKSFAADSLDTLVEKMVVQGDSDDDLHTDEESHCPLEPSGLLSRCQIPCELEGPSEGLHDHHEHY